MACSARWGSCQRAWRPSRAKHRPLHHPPIPYDLLGFGDIPALPVSIPVISKVFSARQVLPTSSTPEPFPQPVSWAPPQPASGLLTAKESSSLVPLPSSPSPIPSFIAPTLCHHSNTVMASSMGAWMASKQ